MHHDGGSPANLKAPIIGTHNQVSDDRMTDQVELEPRTLLLTGAPGVGKTTVIRRLATCLAGKQLRGFFTEEIREGGERKGFRLSGFAGPAQIIAHIDLPRRHRVGKYGVDVAAIDEAAALLDPEAMADVYLVDEIGKMECLSERFVIAMRRLLRSRIPVVATVALRGAGFIAEAKRLPRCVLWQVNAANRDDLVPRIVDWLDGQSPPQG